MKIQYCSDLHLEFKENQEFMKVNPLIPTGSMLILAGDIIPFRELDKHKDFFQFVSDNFEVTYWLPGNHEYYHADAANRSGTVYEQIATNVFLVNNLTVIRKDTRFIFSTLWTSISPANRWAIERGMNDFYQINYKGWKFTADHYNQLHTDALNFVTTELVKPFEGKTVVATHHVPTMLHYPPQYAGSVLNKAFAIELERLIERSDIDCWIYGHHHTNTADFIIGKTQLLTNQLGYVELGEHTLFDPAKTISL